MCVWGGGGRGLVCVCVCVGVCVGVCECVCVVCGGCVCVCVCVCAPTCMRKRQSEEEVWLIPHTEFHLMTSHTEKERKKLKAYKQTISFSDPPLQGVLVKMLSTRWKLSV